MKWMRKMLPAALCAAVLAGCGPAAEPPIGSAAEQQTDEGSGSAQSTEELLAQLNNANSIDALFAQGQTITNQKIIYDNGKEAYSESFLMQKREENYTLMLEGSDGHIEYTTGEMKCMYNPKNKTLSEQVYLENQYQEEQDAWLSSFEFVLDGTEKVVGTTTNDDTTVLELRQAARDVDMSKRQAYGLESGEAFDALCYEITYQEQNKCIEKISISKSVGTNIERVIEIFTTVSEDELEQPDFVAELLDPDETRTVVVYYNDLENKYVLAKDALFCIVVPDGYKMYADASGKTEQAAEQKPGENRVVYLLPDENAVIDPDDEDDDSDLRAADHTKSV